MTLKCSFGGFSEPLWQTEALLYQALLEANLLQANQKRVIYGAVPFLRYVVNLADPSISGIGR